MKKKFLFSVSIILFVINAHGQWVLSNTGLSNTGVFSFAQIGAKLFVGTNIGVDVSTNSAGNWTNVLGPTFPVMALATDGINLFAGAGGVFLSTDSGNTWAPADTGLPGNPVMSLAISGSNIFAATDGAGIFLSTNNGASWSAADSGLTTMNIRVIASSGSNIFAGTFDGGIFLSTNNGAFWTAVNNGIPANEWVRSFLITGSDIFAGTQQGIYHSTNNGSSWSPANTGLPSTDVFSLLQSGSNLLAGTEASGIYLSTDNGNTWNPFNTGFPSFGIAFSLTTNTTNIFAAMYSEGVYTRPLDQLSGISETGSGDVKPFAYPNPVSDEIKFSFPDFRNATTDIYSAMGELIITKKITPSNSTINFKELPRGIYFLKMSWGGKTNFQKLTKP